MTLFVNACVGERSRTEQIARAYLGKYSDVIEVCLDAMYIEPLDTASLQKRDSCIRSGNFSHSFFGNARLFAEADEIIIAAPYWDLSFPAKLWNYLENVCVAGLTFRYTKDGQTVSLCKAKKLTYITTSGGRFQPEFSYNYIRTIADQFFGIRDTKLICAENLDLDNSEPVTIVNDCIRKYCG